MKTTYFRDPDGNIHTVTNESPKGFKNVLFAGHGPDGEEQVYAANVLQKWERVEEPQVEDIQLEFAPLRGADPEDYTNDPVFWILFAVFFILYYWFAHTYIL